MPGTFPISVLALLPSKFLPSLSALGMIVDSPKSIVIKSWGALLGVVDSLGGETWWEILRTFVL